MKEQRRVVKNHEPEDRFIVMDDGMLLLTFKGQKVEVNAVRGMTAEEVIDKGLVVLKEYLMRRMRYENRDVSIETGFCIGSALKQNIAEDDPGFRALLELDRKANHVSKQFQQIINKLEEKSEFPEIDQPGY